MACITDNNLSVLYIFLYNIFYIDIFLMNFQYIYVRKYILRTSIQLCCRCKFSDILMNFLCNIFSNRNTNIEGKLMLFHN